MTEGRQRMLRELIYVDADKVRSLLAQLEEGVTEDKRVTEKKQANLSGGMRNVASREQIWGTEESTQRSFADAIFPALEDVLTAEQYLSDISYEISSVAAADPPGSFVRITAPARLFDARYVANAFAGYATAATGVTEIDPESYKPASSSDSRTKGRPQAKKVVAGPSEAGSLEALIPDFDISKVAGVPSSQLRAFVKVARGASHPGFHLAMSPGGDDGVSVTARLQETRRFLDTEPEILFSRYGVQEQDWTVVGTIGAYSPHPDFAFEPADIERSDGNGVSRGKIVQIFNDLLALLGTLGLADQPQHPGFSVVPFAVYRLILPAGGMQALEGEV
jgi:hypothetical protein